MAGGILQLVAYGAQDIYLTDNPQITFFKVIYRRHTTFSLQPFEATFTDGPNFGKRSKVKLYRLGDLATKMYLRVVVGAIIAPTTSFAWIRRLGHALLREVEFIIGGNTIDKHCGTWLDIWYELTHFGQRDSGYRALIGDVDSMTLFNTMDKPQYVLYIPLQFWLNRNYGLALPLIAIHYHDIFVRVSLEASVNLIVRCPDFASFDQVTILDMGLITDYVYLDMEERRRFAIVTHEYLFDQVQFTGLVDVENTVRRNVLEFTNPVKEIIWAMKNNIYNMGKAYLCYSNKDDWTPDIVACSIEVLNDSILLLPGSEFIIDSSGDKIIIKEGATPTVPGTWIPFEPESVGDTPNGALRIVNESQDIALWLNIDSLVTMGHSMTADITGVIILSIDDVVSIDIQQGLLEQYLSIPLDQITDTRINGPHPGICVYQFSNYGLYITGRVNPITFGLLEYNGRERVERRNGVFFGKLQPYMHHSRTPADGINLYSFAFEPEKHQPTGTSNLSVIENVVLTLWFDSRIIQGDFNKLFIFAFSYNILRIMSGMTGVVY